MEKVIRIVKQGEDESNIDYWLTLSYEERLRNLEKLRNEIINRFYGTRQRFQRIYTIVKRP